MKQQKVEKNPKSHNFEFIAQGYSKYLQCKFCANLMTNARRFFPCGHTFCHQCTQHVQNQPKSKRNCIQCQESIKQIQPDFLVKNMVGQLMVKCLNKDCGYKGEYEQYLQKHSKNCSNEGMSKWLKQIGKYANKINPKRFDQSFQQSEQKQEGQQKVEKDMYQEFGQRRSSLFNFDYDEKQILKNPLKTQLKEYQ